jgi:hypothetical protein
MFLRHGFVGLSCSLCWCVWFGLLLPVRAAEFRAGAAVVDISPTNFPVIVNAMFTERSADRVVDPLEVRALVLDNGRERLALVVVDTCMMARSLIDEAKAIAQRETGLRPDRMLISATHTHSAPSAMGCLGSRIDPRYAAMLPARIAESIRLATARLEPARAGWTTFDATGFTHNRRWIRRLDRIEVDPFGVRSVRAHMHPGHQSPDAIGPSGPVDPAFTLLSIVAADGRPIAVFGNFSMHYYESPLLSSDYFGRWRSKLEARLNAASPVPEDASRPLVAILSQGTSGDLMWMNYGAPRDAIGYDAYAEQLASKAFEALHGIKHHARVPLAMKEAKLPLRYRLCDDQRLAWARELAGKVGDRLPQNLPEIYALEQIHLHQWRETEVVLQALRIGDLAMTALPNEVFAITGLKLKSQSPLPLTMNVELANGGDGYIPPPEQHALGGYTTWAARTAGLETNAEPRITETLLGLLEDVTGRTRRTVREPETDYAKAVHRLRPLAWWRLDEFAGEPRSTRNKSASARLEGYVAHYLDGPPLKLARGRQPSLDGVANHCVHFADGALVSELPLGSKWTVTFWLWNGLPNDAAGTTAELLTLQAPGVASPRLRLCLGGTNNLPGRLRLTTGSDISAVEGTSALAPKTWQHVALVADGKSLRLFLNGHPELESQTALPSGRRTTVRFAGGSSAAPLQGRLDEIAVFTRALKPSEVSRHFTTAR